MPRADRRLRSPAAASAALAACLQLWPGLSIASTASIPAQFRAEAQADQPTDDAAKVLAWIERSGDNAGLPFLIIDKVQAKVFAFYSDGRLRGVAPALLGMAYGDTTVTGIGDRELSNIKPEERTTPAGRFVAALGRDLDKEVLWIDYGAAVSLHRVITSNPKERRLQRLATATPLDNRISYGCINVPAGYFDGIIRPTFGGTHGIVYVLPEVESIEQAFAGYARHAPQHAMAATGDAVDATH